MTLGDVLAGGFRFLGVLAIVVGILVGFFLLWCVGIWALAFIGGHI